MGFYSMSTYFNGWKISKASLFPIFLYDNESVEIPGMNPTTNRNAIFPNVAVCTTDDLKVISESNNHVLPEGAQGKHRRV